MPGGLQLEHHLARSARKAGLYKAGEADLSKVVTLQFVNKGVGQDVKARLGAQQAGWLQELSRFEIPLL